MDADQRHDEDIEKSLDEFFHGALHVAGLVASPGRRIRPYMFIDRTRHMVHSPLQAVGGGRKIELFRMLNLREIE